MRVFLEFLKPGQEVDKDTVLRYKERLTERYAVRSVNSIAIFLPAPVIA